MRTITSCIAVALLVAGCMKSTGGTTPGPVAQTEDTGCDPPCQGSTVCCDEGTSKECRTACCHTATPHFPCQDTKWCCGSNCCAASEPCCKLGNDVVCCDVDSYCCSDGTGCCHNDEKTGEVMHTGIVGHPPPGAEIHPKIHTAP